MKEKSLSVAKRLLEKLSIAHPSVTPMQLIKMVYIAHGYMLGMHGRPLLSEPVQAWQYGPVVRSVYDAVKQYKSNPVQFISGGDCTALGADEEQVLDRVVAIYGKSDGVVLSAATHKKGTPWDITWSMHGKNSDISNDLIENFYSALLKQGKHSAL